MGLKRKGSRLIHVAGENYRWAISRSRQAETGMVSVVIETTKRRGQRAVVRGPCRDFWLDLSDLTPATFNANAYRPVKPAAVEAMILQALAKGWTPHVAKGELKFDWLNGDLQPTEDAVCDELDEEDLVEIEQAEREISAGLELDFREVAAMLRAKYLTDRQ